uniref:PPUP9339 n=1 Tax=Poeciliopsis prolifica TaxID=188132 RepID=A0A0S7EQ24_9TELE
MKCKAPKVLHTAPFYTPIHTLMMETYWIVVQSETLVLPCTGPLTTTCRQGRCIVFSKDTTTNQFRAESIVPVWIKRWILLSKMTPSLVTVKDNFHTVYLCFRTKPL